VTESEAPESEAPESEAPESEEELVPVANFMLLIDPDWQPGDEGDQPPEEAILGGWYFDAEGSTERFVPNPGYRPSRPGSPTDPIDAAIQVVVRGDIDGSGLLHVMRNALLGVAVDGEGAVVVALSPDGVPSVLVTSAPVHRDRCNVTGWVETTIDEIAAALPDEGVDVLINPGAPASIRINAGTIKELVASSVD
jgi:hypothetical protein